MKTAITALALFLGVAAGSAEAQAWQPRQAAGPGTCSEARVYFEYGQDRIGQAGLETMDAMLNRLAGGPVNFVLVGHVDAAEAADPSMQALSDLRATMVAAGFARRQPGGVYQISGVGASQPALETRPGVREPLNRRVEIRACRV